MSTTHQCTACLQETIEGADVVNPPQVLAISTCPVPGDGLHTWTRIAEATQPAQAATGNALVEPETNDRKTIIMNLPFDALLLKRRIAKLLSQNKLHGIVTRKSSPNNSNKFCTEIIFHNARLDVVTKFTNSLSLVLRNSGHGDISVTATVVTHDDGDLDGLRIGITDSEYCKYQGSKSSEVEDVLVTSQYVETWDFDEYSTSLSSSEVVQRNLAPFTQNLTSMAPLFLNIQDAASFFPPLGLLPAAETITKVITVKSSQGNFMTDIPCDCVDWDWLEERYRGKRIINFETKDSDNNRVEIDSPKFVLHGGIMYITLA